MIGGLRRQQLLRYSGRVDRLVRAKSGAGPIAELRRAYQGGKTPHAPAAKTNPTPPPTTATPSPHPPPSTPTPVSPGIPPLTPPPPPPGRSKVSLPLVLGGSLALLGAGGAAWWQYELGRWGPGPVIPRGLGGEATAGGVSEGISTAGDSGGGGGGVRVGEGGLGLERVGAGVEEVVKEGKEVAAVALDTDEKVVEEGKDAVEGEEVVEGREEVVAEVSGSAGGAIQEGKAVEEGKAAVGSVVERGMEELGGLGERGGQGGSEGWGQPEDEFAGGGGGAEVAVWPEEEDADLADVPGQLGDVATEEVEEMGGEEDGRLRSLMRESRTAEALLLAGHEVAVRKAQEKKTEGEAVEAAKVANVAKVAKVAEGEEGGESWGEAEAEMAKMAKLINAVAEAAKQDQAEVDAGVIERLKADLEKRHQRDLNEERAQVIRLGEEVHRKEREMRRQRQQSEWLKTEMEKKTETELRQALKAKDEEGVILLEEAKLTAEVRGAAQLAAERAEGLNTVTGIGMQVKALREAFFTKSEATRKSHGAHKIATSTFSLEVALRGGGPMGGQVSNLEGAVGGKGQDPLVDAIIASLPPAVLHTGTPSRAQLQRQLAGYESYIRELSLLPPDAGGFLAHGLAKVISAIKVKEDGNEGSRGVEAALARAELLLAEGRLSEAAAALEEGVKGTKAEEIAEVWANNARNRAVAEQALEVLQAHSTALAAGLS